MKKSHFTAVVWKSWAAIKCLTNNPYHTAYVEQTVANDHSIVSLTLAARQFIWMQITKKETCELTH